MPFDGSAKEKQSTNQLKGTRHIVLYISVNISQHKCVLRGEGLKWAELCLDPFRDDHHNNISRFRF